MGRVRESKQMAAFATLNHYFETPARQQRGFASLEAAQFSAATLLAGGRLKLSFSAALGLVKEWYQIYNH
jgi:hypothetical protein